MAMSIFTRDYVATVYHEYLGVELKAGHPYLEQYLEAMKLSPKWREWVDQVKEQGDIDLRSFTLTDINFFGPVAPEKLGFFKGHCDAYDAVTKEKIVSNIVFGRGGCVACLVICTAEIDGVKKRLVPMTEQIRMASGGRRIEAMAGMLDASTREFRGPVVKELEEEFGIKITETDSRLKRLPGKKAWPSPGGCDEAIHLFYMELDITREKYEEMCTRTYGQGDDWGIRIRFYDYDTFDDTLNEIGDFKAGEMWRRYQLVKRQEAAAAI
jgi:ADP-sugar diphosphatase